MNQPKLYSPSSVYIHKSFQIVKLNLLRLCSEKTIYKLFIYERAEDQLLGDLLYDSMLLSIVFFYTQRCKQTHVNKTKRNYRYSISISCRLQQLKNQYSCPQTDEILPKINAFKQYYVPKQELVYGVYFAHDGIVDCGKGVRTLEILKQYLYGRSIYNTKY